MPIILEVYAIIVLVFFIKHESIIQLLQEEEASSDLLQKELRKVYSIPNSMTYEQLAKKLKGEIKFSDPSPTTALQALSGKQYRLASVSAIVLACA